MFSVLLIISFYFLLTYNCQKDYFFPHKYNNEDQYHYNRLVHSLKSNKLCLYDINDFTNESIELLHRNDFYNNYPYYYTNYPDIKKTFDLSYYKDKIYLYFGLTPILLSYLPFNLLSGYCLSDNIIAFVLISLIFIFSLLILTFFNNKFLNYNLKPHFKYLTIILIGLCNYEIILAIRTEIYEVCVLFSAFLLLITIYLFLQYLLTDKNQNKLNILTFSMGLLLSLSVGSRPHYVLTIPIFFLLIIYIEHNKCKNIKRILVTLLYFLLPCIIYGIIVAMYNYLRFDSIFEFGWKYQLNGCKQYNFIPAVKDFLIGLKYHLLQFPENNISDSYTFFSFTMGKGHRIANEFVVGLIFVCPMALLMLFTPFKLKKEKKFISIVFILLFSLFFINFDIACLFGPMRRYAFEYIYILTILYFMSFFVLDKNILNKKYQNLVFIFFIIVSIYMLYLHLCLLFCIQNAFMFIDENNVNFYTKLINFLFNSDIPNDFLLHKLEIFSFLDSL